MEQIIKIINNAKKPLTAVEVAKKLNMPQKQVKMVKGVLDNLVSQGKLVKASGAYGKIQSLGLIQGKVCSTKTGADFFQSDELKEDLKIIGSKHLYLMHNDIVLAKKRGQNCAVVKIIKRANEKIVGTVYKDAGTWYLVPDDKKLHVMFIVSKKDRNLVQAGDKAVAKILSYPTGHEEGVCKIEERLGSAEDDNTAITATLFRYGVQQEFSEKVLREADGIKDEITDSMLEGRLDLRKLNVITIDGDDAKDLDDAVSLEMTEKGDFLLGVHIADVSHYVALDSAIDVEARSRATSVYIPGTVFPMLPKSLSNGVCSLNENVDRLALSCFMIITRQGKIIDSHIAPSVIKSKHRMTYSVVTDMLENSSSEYRKQYKDIFGMLLLMRQLAEILIATAEKRGSIDFDLPEAKIELDENSFPVKISEYEIGISNKIIEQFMLAANQTVAAYMNNHAHPAIYRVHEKPEEKKLEVFRELVEVFGYRLPKEPKPIDFQRILQQAEGTPQEALIKKTMLRSMSKAKYKPTNDGHFGLAYENYLHFTSPIRRYPDLTVHRALNMLFQKNHSGLRELSSRLEGISTVSTEREINAAACERDVDDIRKAQFMSKLIGERFSGTVSGVTAYGMFVELANTVEGFVPIGTMQGYYDYDEAHFRLKSVNNCFTLGDRVEVSVFGVNIPEGRVEFTLLT